MIKPSSGDEWRWRSAFIQSTARQKLSCKYHTPRTAHGAENRFARVTFSLTICWSRLLYVVNCAGMRMDRMIEYTVLYGRCGGFIQWQIICTFKALVSTWAIVPQAAPVPEKQHFQNEFCSAGGPPCPEPDLRASAAASLPRFTWVEQWSCSRRTFHPARAALVFCFVGSQLNRESNVVFFSLSSK